ncbi:PucR family transcriptional regulator [Iningainema tapete]|uniref:Helix-turn-helix domain-containing protein n=1 Tax=Iningainema tapete BLCC-T55 TaxID=2748662 RepID=A0A8J6XS36_9CYAN|nr:helix-turn-helix domain-containing protein [Iningainema tapete]MBD2777304.1 helix-turn-helix domain-containing protein [Iningainema tapete BLCC-T55]
MTVLTTTVQFERVAKIVAERMAQLLCATVFVIDQNWIIVASSNPKLLGLSFNRVSKKLTLDYLEVQLTFDTQMGKVIIGKPNNGEEISPRLAQVIVELVVNQTAMIDELPNQHQLKNKFIYDLLHGLIEDEATVLRHSKLLGLDLTPPRAVILIDAADYILGNSVSNSNVQSKNDSVSSLETQARRRATLVIGSVVSFFHLPNDTICAYLGDGEVAVLKASDTKNLGYWANCGDVPECSSSWANLTALKRAAFELMRGLGRDTGASISVGIGRYHPGIKGLASSYQDARAALSLGCRFGDRNQVHCLDQLGIAAFIGVSDEQTKIELATYLLSPLNHEPELLTTLDTFFAQDCCPSSTASKLLIHRNTLSYRLDKITSLTGLDPRCFDDAVQIRLALLLRKLR